MILLGKSPKQHKEFSEIQKISQIEVLQQMAYLFPANKKLTVQFLIDFFY